MKCYEDEDENFRSPSFALALGLLVCLCGIGTCLEFGTPQKVRTRVSAEDPITLAAACAAPEQQISGLRHLENLPLIEGLPKQPRFTQSAGNDKVSRSGRPFASTHGAVRGAVPNVSYIPM